MRPTEALILKENGQIDHSPPEVYDSEAYRIHHASFITDYVNATFSEDIPPYSDNFRADVWHKECEERMMKRLCDIIEKYKSLGMEFYRL